MAEYIASFITGFEPVVSAALPAALRGARVDEVFAGLVRCRYDGAPSDVASLPFINNSFAVIRYFKGGGLSFEGMAAKAAGGAAGARFRAAGASPPAASFRVRFSRENRFEKAPKSAVEATERAVVRYCGMTPDRLSPDTEFWYVIRREGFGFFGRLLKKRDFTEKNLHRGELRPELAYLLCRRCFDGDGGAGVVCDPFAGYGAIPAQIIRHFAYEKLYVNDIDAGLAAAMKGALLTGAGGGVPADGIPDTKIVLTCVDAADLAHIPGGSVDHIVTDPPWGFASDVGDLAAFYRGALVELRRVLAPGGRIVLLTGQPEHMLNAAERAGLAPRSRLDILVNGKKAAVLCVTGN